MNAHSNARWCCASVWFMRIYRCWLINRFKFCLIIIIIITDAHIFSKYFSASLSVFINKEYEWISNKNKNIFLSAIFFWIHFFFFFFKIPNGCIQFFCFNGKGKKSYSVPLSFVCMHEVHGPVRCGMEWGELCFENSYFCPFFIFIFILAHRIIWNGCF